MITNRHRAGCEPIAATWYAMALLPAISITAPFIDEIYKHTLRGCRFYLHCNVTGPEYSQTSPEPRDIGGEHRVACFEA